MILVIFLIGLYIYLNIPLDTTEKDNMIKEVFKSEVEERYRDPKDYQFWGDLASWRPINPHIYYDFFSEENQQLLSVSLGNMHDVLSPKEVQLFLILIFG